MDKYVTVALDEREQAAYIALRFEPKTDVLLAAARVVIAAQNLLNDKHDTPGLEGALRLAVLEYEYAVNPLPADEVG